MPYKKQTPEKKSPANPLIKKLIESEKAASAKAFCLQNEVDYLEDVLKGKNEQIVNSVALFQEELEKIRSMWWYKFFNYLFPAHPLKGKK